jgi:carbon monoxide dehydrogenase subunit G
MHLEATVLIHRTPEQVWAYLGDVSNVPRWDRGVAKVRQTSSSQPGIGFEFDTLAHPSRRNAGKDSGKMSYCITEADPARGCTVQLTSSGGNARFFKNAEWRFQVEPAAEGALVICAAHFTLRLPYLVMTPIFYGMRKAIRSDLENLKRVLENDSAAVGS